MNIETESELKEFIGSLLDLNIQKNKIFLDELLKKLKKPSNVPVQEVKVSCESIIKKMNKFFMKNNSKRSTANLNKKKHSKQKKIRPLLINKIQLTLKSL